MPILAIEETNVKVIKERNRFDVERLAPKEPRRVLTPAENAEENWSAICQEPGCEWRVDGLSDLRSATTSGYAHSSITRRGGKAHAVLPEGLVRMSGMLIVADEIGVGDDE